MSIYPFSVLFSDAPVWSKLLAVFAIVLCISYAVWFYRHQSRSLLRNKNDAKNSTAKMPNLRNSNSHLPETDSAPLNKPDIISPVAYPDTRKDTTNLSTFKYFTKPSISSKKPASQSQQTGEGDGQLE